VLLDGELDVTKDGLTVGTLGPGEVVGEMAYVLEEPRSCDVRAATDGLVLSLSERTLRSLPERHPAAAAKLHVGLAKTLCRRLAQANEHRPAALVTAS
jgi:CRP-like cAMP-binding protein